MLQGLETVYTGGRSSNELENSVERALTRRDVHGRVLTPKEAFRDLCHQCARLSRNFPPPSLLFAHPFIRCKTR